MALLAALLLFPLQAFAQQESVLFGKINRVEAGDVLILHNGVRETEIRLSEAACPKPGQDFSKAARRFTTALLYGREVRVENVVKRKGKLYGRVVLDEKYLDRELLQAGLAWWDVRYSKDEELAALQDAAQEAGKGLWALKKPEPPWEYGVKKRKRKR
ncbi:MAG TPA: nuclease [Elusimicrobia bacterium]|nr:nuclease [Elusimicrobiota bacterium]